MTAWAIHVREDNLAHILAYAKTVDMNLSYLRDNMEYEAEDGNALYLVTSGQKSLDNVTFTTMIEDDFRRIWKFKFQENPNKFVQIEPV